MPDIHREEVHARPQASEARVATAVTEMRADLKTGLSEMRADIHQMFSAQTKWIVVIVFGALAAAGTLFSFLKPSNPVPASQSVPFVIYAQPFPVQPPAAVASDDRH